MTESADMTKLRQGERERVVLLDDVGRPIGTHDKISVHTEATPLHAAFSCYLLNNQGEVLLTRRALSKLTWPGVWTNSFCGHPAPEESLEDAITRRASHELGAQINTLTVVLPDFRYRAVDASGIVENEVCPVVIAELVGDFVPNPSEVGEWAWISARSLEHAVQLAPFAFSPWMVMQLPLLGLDSLVAVPDGESALPPGSGAP